ncbi:MAG: energy-coupling factor transporter transmembrane protein EcfT [Lachnospiraceae bacterium]|nr:energy-coupling factor transporter transmembrane protein EcfT [Lachnospiraceae bacterium]
MKLPESGTEEVFINFDPRTKLLLLIVVNTVIISDSKSLIIWWLKMAFVVVVFLLLIDMKKIKMAMLYVVIYTLAMAGDHILVSGSVNGMSVGGLVLRIVVYLIERMLPSVMLAWFVLHSTKVSEFIAAMQKMHLPQTIIIPFAVIFRFFPTIADEYSSIQDAMKMRDIRFGTGIGRGIEYRMVPLLVSVTKIGDELSAAAMTRGLTTDTKRTSYCKVGFHIADLVAFAIMIVGTVIFSAGLILG